jgi:quercetin dioxygenase-like cupin family protein
MNCSRRDLSALLPMLAAMAATRADAALPTLPSRCYEFASLPEKTNPETHNEMRNVFDGLTHDGTHIDMHITTLMPGLSPHPEHHHEWEELMMIQNGTLEMTIQDKKARLGPGSVIYVYSNEQHGLKNVGDSPAQYFVLAIGRPKT